MEFFSVDCARVVSVKTEEYAVPVLFMGIDCTSGVVGRGGRHGIGGERVEREVQASRKGDGHNLRMRTLNDRAMVRE